MKLVPGRHLTRRLRRQVFETFIKRWTFDNKWLRHFYCCPSGNFKHPERCGASCRGLHPTIPLVSDRQWLEDHAFYIDDSGNLSAQHSEPKSAYLAEEESLACSP